VAKWVYEDTPSSHYAEVRRWMREGATTVLAAAEDRVRREHPEVEVTTELLPGDPRTALIHASEGAELLVVGSRGIGGIRGLLVGSVAHGVAAHARTNVVLIRELPRPPRREIVAGVDGSPGGLCALDFALTEAELHGARVRAVQAWAWPHPSGFEPADPNGEQNALRALQKLTADGRSRHPGVEVVAEVVHGHPIEVLKEAAARADLLVVGTRGHGQLTGMIMGSISHALLHHAPCPLAIVRP
jgi:nucleotide-binding universal stress UspA family protein